MDGGKIMEIKVRKLEPVIVQTIDELAIKHGFVYKNGKPRREQFLRWHFKQLCVLGEVKEMKNIYESQILKLNRTIAMQYQEIIGHIEQLEHILLKER